MDRSELLKLMSTQTTARKYAKGAVLFREGDTPDLGLCLVLAGSVQVTHDVSGKRISLGTVVPGEFLGETALVLSRNRMATATSSSDETAIMFLTRDRVLQEAHRNFVFLSTLLQEAVGRMEHVMQVLMRQPRDITFVVDESLKPVMQENKHHMARIPFLLNHTRNMFVGTNKPVFTQGQRNDGIMYLVTDGIITLERHQPEKEPKPLYQVQAGDFFGYSRVATCPTRFFTAVARGESAHVIICDEELLTRVFHLDMEIAYFMLRSIVVKLVILNDSLQAAAQPILQNAGADENRELIRKAFAEAMGQDSAQAETTLAEAPAGNGTVLNNVEEV